MSKIPDGCTYNIDDEGSSLDIDLEYDYYKEQEKIKESFLDADTEDDIVAFTAEYGAGKSYAGGRALIEGALKYGGRWLVMAINYQKGRKSTYASIFENLPSTKGSTLPSNGDPTNSELVKEYNKNEKRLTLINGAVIEFSESTSYESEQGTKYNGIWLDEFAHYKADLHHVLQIITSRLRAGKPAKCLITTTGKGYNDYYDIVRLGEDANGNQHNYNIKHITADLESNQYLDEDILEDMKRRSNLDDYGFTPSENVLFNNFSKEKNVVPKEEIEDDLIPDWHAYGFDYGWHDPQVCLHVRKTRSNKLVVVDEYYNSRKPTEHLIKWLRNKPKGIMYSDHDPRQLTQIRQEAPVRPVEADKTDKSISEKKLNDRFKEKNGIIGLQIVEECKETWKEFSTITEDDSNPDDHAIDSLRYVVTSMSDRQIQRSSGSTNNKDFDIGVKGRNSTNKVDNTDENPTPNDSRGEEQQRVIDDSRDNKGL